MKRMKRRLVVDKEITKKSDCLYLFKLSKFGYCLYNCKRCSETDCPLELVKSNLELTIEQLEDMKKRISIDMKKNRISISSGDKLIDIIDRSTVLIQDHIDGID